MSTIAAEEIGVKAPVKGARDADATAAVAAARRGGEDPVPYAPGVRTFYCWFGGSGKINGVEQSRRPSNMQIPVGGERRMDAANRVINAPFKMIEFVEGIFRTDDQELVDVLVKMMKQAPNITENQEVYLNNILPQDQTVTRLEQKLAEARSEVNRLKDQLKRGIAPRNVVGEKPAGAARQGAIGSGSVPRRGSTSEK